MPRGTKLNAEEQAMIIAFHESGTTQRKIASIIGRSQNVVKNFLKKGDNYNAKSKSGRPRKIDARMERSILRMSYNQNLSSRKIAKEFHSSISREAVRKVLRKSPNIIYKKLSKRSPLTPPHRETRLRFAHEVMTWNEEWISVVFNGEKKFNLDGPDGYSHYWHDLRSDPNILSRQQADNESVMIWGAFSFNGVVGLTIVDGKMDSKKYTDMLENTVIPFGELICSTELIFQQDNALLYVSNTRHLKNWFSSKNIRLLKWPPRCPDLNPMENLWGTLAKHVYANNRTFSSKNELISSIEDCWYNLDIEICQNLVNSMKNRIICVVKKKGRLTQY